MSRPDAFPAEFLEKLQSACCPYLAAASVDGDGFLPRAKRALLQGLVRLHAFPRDDRFWLNTNGQATLFKLRGFSELLLQRDPGDLQALWCQISLDQWFGSGYFRPEAWRQIRRREKMDVRWPIHQAYYIAAELGEYASWRSCLSRDLAYFLREEGLREEAASALLALASEVEPHPLGIPPAVIPGDWANRVLSGLRDPALWEAVRQVDVLCENRWKSVSDLLFRSGFGVSADEAAVAGWKSANPGRSWGCSESAALEGFREGEIQRAAELQVNADEQNLTLLFGSFAFGKLLALLGCGALHEDAFRIGEEYLADRLRYPPR